LNQLEKLIENKKQNAASSSSGPSDPLLSSDYSNMSSMDIQRLVSEMTNTDNDAEYFTQDIGKIKCYINQAFRNAKYVFLHISTYWMHGEAVR